MNNLTGNVKSITLTIAALLATCYAISTYAEEPLAVTTSTAIYDSSEISDLYINDTPPGQTIVDYYAQDIDHLFVNDSAIYNHYAGRVNFLAILDNQSTTNVHDGYIDTILATTDSTVNINNGTVNFIDVTLNAAVTIHNIQNDFGMQFADQSTLTVHGGEIALIAALGNSTINIRGGQIDHIELGQLPTDQSIINITGGILDLFSASGDGTLNIYGIAMQFDPIAGRFNQGQLTGYWPDATTFTLDYVNTGQDPVPNVILHHLPLPGDTNNDSIVNLIDLTTLGENYGLSPNATRQQGDFNDDGRVDLLDLVSLGQFYGFGVTNVPEPASLSILTIAALILTRRPHQQMKPANKRIHKYKNI